MKTKDKKKELDRFTKNYLKRSDCIIGGSGGVDGDIDRDKVGKPPRRGL